MKCKMDETHSTVDGPKFYEFFFALRLVRVGSICVIARHGRGSNFDAETRRSYSDSYFRSCLQSFQEHFGIRRPT